MRWPKYWSFSFSIIPSKEISGLISFRMDWLDLLAVQGTFRSLLQHQSSKVSILWCSDFLIVQVSHPYMINGKTIALTCLLRNLYVGQEATVRTGHGITDWFQIGKGVRQGCILSPSYLTSMQSTSWETLGWKKHKLESRLPGEISITSDMQMTPPLWQKVKRN